MHQQLIVHSAGVHSLLGLFHAGHHASQCAKATHLGHLAELGAQVVHVELPLGHFGREFIRVLFFDHLGRTFDQADDVTHAQNAPCNTAWVKCLNGVKLLADTCKFDWFACNGAHRQSGTTTGVTVHAREHDTSEINPFAKAFGDVDCVLPRERVHDQQDFLWYRNLRHRLHFVHQLLIDVQPASGIEDEDVKALQLCRLHRALGDVDGHLPLNDGQGRNISLGTKRTQLLLRGRTIDVERCHQDFLALLRLQHLRDFCSRRGFTRTLQTNHHDNRRWRNGEV